MGRILFNLAFLFLLFSCFKSKKALNDNILDIALTTEIPTLDHAISYDTVSAEVVYQIHEPLLEYEYLLRPYTLKPLTAAKLPVVSNGGKTYTFSIKDNIFYHPHVAFKNKLRKLKSDDFINQIKRIIFDKKSNGTWLFKNIEGVESFKKNVKNYEDIFEYDISGIKKIDNLTFSISLIRPKSQFIYAFAMSFSAPAPKELILYYKNDLSVHPIGTGPFKFKKWDRSLALELERFSGYRDSFYPKNGDRYSYEQDLLKSKGEKIPFIDGIKFHILSEAQTRWLNFLKKNIDFIILTKDHFTAALGSNGELNSEYKKMDIDLQISPTLTYWWLAFNMKDQLLGKNKNLRLAIAHAVNIEKYIELFTNSIGQKANSIFPPGIPGYNPSSELPYEYNIEKAKKLLSLAGYPNGKGLPVLRYDIRGTSNVARQGGEFIKRELSKIGINVKVVVNTFSAFLQKAANDKLQFWQGGWAMDYPDPENIVALLTEASLPPGPNATKYVNPTIEELYKKLLTYESGSDLKEILVKIEKTINKDLPWVMMFYSRNYVLQHNYIKNFRHSDLIYNNYKYIKLEKSK